MFHCLRQISNCFIIVLCYEHDHIKTIEIHTNTLQYVTLIAGILYL